MEVELDVELLPKQAEYVNSISDIAIYHGGVGSGKSIADVVLAIKTAIEWPGIDILVGAPTYGMLRDTIMREFSERCPSILLEKFTTGIYPEAVFIPNRGQRSTIRFRSYDKPGKPKGLTIGMAILDEITEIEEDVLNEILRRVRQAGMPNYIRFSTNPDSKMHYVYKRFIEPAEMGTIPINRLHSIHTTTYDNFLLPENYIRQIEQLKITNPAEYMRAVLGLWGDFDENSIGAFEIVPAFSSPYLVAFLDTSFSDSTVSDRTALSIVGFVPQFGLENKYWPIEFTGKSWQKSITNIEVIVDMLNFLHRFTPIEVQVESQLGDSTQTFIDNFRNMERQLNLSPKNHWTVLHQTKNKHERIMLEVAGNKPRMKVLEDTPADYLNPIVAYTKKAEHDDEADSLAGAIELWRTSKNLRDYILMAERGKR